MEKQYNVAVLVGSLRKNSFSRKIARALMACAPRDIALEIVEIAQIQIYNEDLEGQPPLEWTAFRERIRAADAVLFVTPEYNRSVPGCLKNALDVGSRPPGANVWNGKPGAVVSVTPGAMGGFGANHHLRQSLVFLNVLALAQPEAYIGHADQLLEDSGEVSNPSTVAFFEQIMFAFSEEIQRLKRKRDY